LEPRRTPASRWNPSDGESGRRKFTSQQGGKAARAPEQTFEEVQYLKRLIDSSMQVRVKLTDGEEVTGAIEYYDHSFIRLTREGAPNLFIFKHDIKYIQEES
jgi:sRNA-binding regulator protein Hfq